MAVEGDREGLDVAADCTPFHDGGGGPMVILPDWVMADPRKRTERLATFKDELWKQGESHDVSRKAWVDWRKRRLP